MTERPINLNANTYALASATSSAAITLVAADVPETSYSKFVDVYNDSEYTAYVISGATSPTATKPASATVPVGCSVVPAGGRATFTLIEGHKYIACISDGASAGKYIFFKVGSGI